MPTKLMLAFVGMDLLFAGCGGLLLGFSLLSEQAMRATPTVDNVTKNLLLGQCPLTGMTFLGYNHQGPLGHGFDITPY